MENNWLRRRVLEKKNPGRQQPCWGSLFCTNLTQPTGALDYNTGKAVLKLLQDTCRNTGTTVIVITHNQALTAMADRVITVKSGTVEKVVMNDNIRNVEDLEW